MMGPQTEIICFTARMTNEPKKVPPWLLALAFFDNDNADENIAFVRNANILC